MEERILTDGDQDLLLDLQTTMDNHQIKMVYVGGFSQQVVKSFLAMTEKNFDAEGVESSIRRKVFNVMVESLQNICKHSVDDIPELTPAFIIKETEDAYYIISGNAILHDKKIEVKERIDHINSLDKDQLKAYYKETRLKSRISDVGGAGLGFIDMARKSENRLNYDFDEVNETYSYFVLSVRINK